MSISQDGRLHKIYLLRDPRDMRVRYVGVTVAKLNIRLNGHICNATTRPKCHRDYWIRQLVGLGLRPIIELIEETYDRDRECFWVSKYQPEGNLTNLTPGGGGFPGHIFTEEQKKHLSKVLKESIRARGGYTPEQIEKSAKARRGQKRTPEQRHKLHLAHVAQPPRNKYGYKGIYSEKRRELRGWAYYAAVGSIYGTKVHLGWFRTAEEAARRYDEWALKAHGEGAYLNFPPSEGG